MPKSEVAKQFEDIWKKHHDPEHRERVRIQKNREKRKDTKRKDYGID